MSVKNKHILICLSERFLRLLFYPSKFYGMNHNVVYKKINLISGAVS